METIFQQDYFEFGLIVACLAASAVMSAAETAITSLGTLKAKHLLESGERPARQLTLWLNHPGHVLTTILIFNNFLNILATVTVTDLTARLSGSQVVGIATGLSTLMILVFGEIIPKSYARTHSEQMALPALRFVYVLYLLTLPLVWIFSEFGTWIVKLGGVKKDTPPITEEELEYLVNVGERAGVLEETKKEMIVGVFEFSETKVREVMTPRPDIWWLRIDSTYDDTLKLAIESGMSRIPVCSADGVDHVVGILLVKDLLRVARSNGHGRTAFSLKDIMRQPFFIPESKLIMDVFKELKSSKNHIAVVIDEHGGTAGLVTMEDILEEIVGEIQDEYDTEEAEIVELDAGIYDVAGSYHTDEFLEFFEIQPSTVTEMPEEGIDTIGGWITSLLGELPEVGKTVRIGQLNVEITDVERHRVKRIRVSKILEAGEMPPSE